MRRMVVTTARGQLVTEADVAEDQLVEVVSAWVRAMPDAGIYLDGELVPPQARLAMQLAMSAQSASAATTATTVAALPEPERLRSYAEVMQLAFNDLRDGYVASLRHLHECATQYSAMWLEREKQLADEAARQRELTHQSLKDLDLLERCVAGVKLKDGLATAGVHNISRARRVDGMRFTDLLAGFLRALSGDKK